MFRRLYGHPGKPQQALRSTSRNTRAVYSNPWSFYCGRYEYERLLDLTHLTQPKTLDSVDCIQELNIYVNRHVRRYFFTVFVILPSNSHCVTTTGS